MSARKLLTKTIDTEERTKAQNFQVTLGNNDSGAFQGDKTTNVMNIKVTVKPGSKAARCLDQAMADKAAFRQAGATGKMAGFMKRRDRKHIFPVSLK